MAVRKWFTYACVLLTYALGIKGIVTEHIEFHRYGFDLKGTDAVVIGWVHCILATIMVMILLREDSKTKDETTQMRQSGESDGKE